MRALITGITGQDGSYLAEYLLGKNYDVVGLKRHTSHGKGLDRIQHIIDNKKFTLIDSDITDNNFINRLIRELQPDELYHMAAISYVPTSWLEPHYTFTVNTLSTLYILESICQYSRHTRMYFAGSSEQFGMVKESPQIETTPFYPRSPYAVSKVASFEMVRNYRESYGLFCCSGLTFNHESVRRGQQFVTKKICHIAAAIKYGFADSLVLGNVNAKRDWSYAGDIIKAFHLMLQADKPKDYVIASGKTYSVLDFVKLTFDYLSLDYTKYLIQQEDSLIRPAEVQELHGDPALISHDLGWKTETSLEQLFKMMVDYEINQFEEYGKKAFLF